MRKSKSKTVNDAPNRKLQVRTVADAVQTDENPDGSRGWVPKGEILEWAGRRIPGMVYFGTPETYICPKTGNECASSVYIDPIKPVSEIEDADSQNRPVKTHYGEMHPVHRAKYLDWLANGRTDRYCDISFPVLYFFGLERRFFLGNPNSEEKQDILKEFKRLKRIYKSKKYCQKFVNLVEDFENGYLNYANKSGNLTVSTSEANSHDLFENLKELCEKSVNVAPLDVDDYLKILFEVAGQKLSNSGHWGHWFEKLTRIRFANYYPNGCVLEPPTKLNIFKYKACSSEFVKHIQINFKGKPAYYVGGFAVQIERVRNFAESVATSLDEYKEFAERSPDTVDIKQALKKLPRELWLEFEKLSENVNEYFKDVRSWARELVNSETNTTVADVIERTGGRLFNESTIIDRDWDDARDFLALCGYGTAPDANLRFRRDSPDEPAVIYELENKEERLSGLSNAYKSALCEISVGAYLLGAENCSEQETARILGKVISQKEGLTADQKSGLVANLQCILIRPQDKEYPIRLGKAVKGDRKTELRHFIVDLAQRDEKIRAGTVSAIEKVYAEFGWDASEAYSDLHAGEIASNSVKRRGNGSSELDESRIKSIRSDTDKVSKVLGSIFTDSDGAGKEPAEDAHVFAKGLDAKHVELLRKLLEKDHWKQEEFEELVRGQGLLPVGAVETINEWTFENFEEPLLDENEGYQISPEIADTLKTGFESSGQATGGEQ